MREMAALVLLWPSLKGMKGGPMGLDIEVFLTQEHRGEEALMLEPSLNHPSALEGLRLVRGRPDVRGIVEGE